MSSQRRARLSSILAGLNACSGCRFWRDRPGDIIGIVEGRFAAFILTLGEPVSEARHRFKADIVGLGGFAAVVHDVPGAVDAVAKWKRQVAAERGTL